MTLEGYDLLVEEFKFLLEVEKPKTAEEKLVAAAQIIDPSLHSHTKISFGSTVTLSNLDTDEEETYTLCGVLETEPENGLISVHSPIAKAMMGKEVDDDFKIQLPTSNKEYEIIEITYKNIFSLKNNIRTKVDFSFH